MWQALDDEYNGWLDAKLIEKFAQYAEVSRHPTHATRTLPPPSDDSWPEAV
jgi:hypothetical protein